MEKNVGGSERTARVLVGAILMAGGIAAYTGSLKVASSIAPQALTSLLILLVGVILLATGLVQSCPVNSLLGRNTCPVEG